MLCTIEHERKHPSHNSTVPCQLHVHQLHGQVVLWQLLHDHFYMPIGEQRNHSAHQVEKYCKLKYTIRGPQLTNESNVATF